MYQIIDGRGTGKTSRLLLLAKEMKKPIICANPYAMREKAHAYGIVGVEIYSYYDAVESDMTPFFDGYLIDELTAFTEYVMHNNKMLGFSLSKDD